MRRSSHVLQEELNLVVGDFGQMNNTEEQLSQWGNAVVSRLSHTRAGHKRNKEKNDSENLPLHFC